MINIDMSIVDDIIRKSLNESRSQEEVTKELRQQRAIYDALKAMWILCKDQPMLPVQITGVEQASPLYSVVSTLAKRVKELDGEVQG